MHAIFWMDAKEGLPFTEVTREGGGRGWIGEEGGEDREGQGGGKDTLPFRQSFFYLLLKS